jgi:signal transduction histidine kinase
VREWLRPGWIALVWAPLVAITLLHYATPHHVTWVHDVARRLFYLPIVFAALRGGLPAGLVVAGVVVAAYAPHAFWMESHHDPATTAQKLLEMGFYVVLGAATGALADRLERAQDAVRVKDAQLQRAARLEALGQLTAGLAHEIRNPLHAMRGTAEILLDAVPREGEQRRLAEAHLAEIDRLSGLLKRFLDFARPETRQLTPVSLRAVVERVRDLLSAQAGQQGTALDVEGGDDVVVPGDFDLLVQAVLAIAINALQAVGNRGHVRLAVERGAIEVWNDGPPLPAHLRERLFDPFVSTRPDGTGLGLAAAWRIARDHGGGVEAENLPEGVVFRVLVGIEAAKQ